MMGYSRFQLTSVLRNKLNFIPLILLLFAVVVGLVLNNRTASSVGHKSMVEEEIANNTKVLDEISSELDTVAKDSEKYQNLKEEQVFAEERLALSNDALSFLNEGDYQQFYNYKIDSIRQNKLLINNGGAPVGEDLNVAMDRDVLFYQTLADKNLPYDDPDFPITGVNYVFWVLRTIIPILYTIGIIFIFTQVFTNSFVEGLDKDRLIPISQGTRVASSIGVGGMVSFGLLFLTLIISYFLASVSFGTGSLEYPILSYGSDGNLFFSAGKEMLFPTIILQLFSILNCLIFIYLVSFLSRNKLTALFVSFVVLIGGMLAIYVIEPLTKVAAFLPTTYLHSMAVVTGQLPKQIENNQVSFWMGNLVLGVSCLIMISRILFCYKIMQRIR